MASVLIVACTTPNRPAKLPERSPYVAVLSGQMPPPIGEVARHAWIVVQTGPGERHRYEYGGSGGPDPFDDFASGDVMLHGVIEGSAEKITELDACLKQAHSEFHRRHPDYFPIPGPNSNTYVAFLGRRCSLMIELPATAIGRDYVGIVGADVTEGGTGIQIGSIPFGIRIGLREGIGIQIFGVALGVHFWPPGIDVPVNPGRIGFAEDGHIDREPPDGYTKPWPEEIATTGAASVQLYAMGLGVLDPGFARGLEGEALLGLSVRAVYGEYVGYAAGIDFEIGMGFPTGLAGRFHFYPVGAGVFLSQTGFFSLVAGIGASGVTERMPTALELPVEARFEFNAGPRARLALYGRQAFGLLDHRRVGGLLDHGELTLGVRARIGDGWGYDQGALGSGYFFALERRDIGHSAMLGFAFGTEIDAGLRSR